METRQDRDRRYYRDQRKYISRTPLKGRRTVGARFVQRQPISDRWISAVNQVLRGGSYKCGQMGMR